MSDTEKIDLSKLDDCDLMDELFDRGYVYQQIHEFDTDDLIEELDDRGYTVHESTDRSEDFVTLNKIFHLRREGKPYDEILNKFLCDKLGRVI